MSSRRVHKMNSTKAKWFETSVNNGVILLGILENIAGLATLPFLKEAAGLTLKIIEAIQQTKANKADFRSLAEDAAEFIAGIFSTYKDSPDQASWPPTEIAQIISNLLSALTEILSSVEDEVNKSCTLMLIFHKADAEKVKKYRETLKLSIDKFQVVSGISLPITVASMLKKQRQLAGLHAETFEKVNEMQAKIEANDGRKEEVDAKAEEERRQKESEAKEREGAQSSGSIGRTEGNAGEYQKAPEIQRLREEIELLSREMAQRQEEIDEKRRRLAAMEDSTPPQLAVSSSRSDSEIYYQNLVTKRRGLPLWIPQPPYNLPTHHQQNGVSFGDVGVVSPSGSFYFFFNIFYSSDHIINSGGVPEGFKPLDLCLDSLNIRREQVFNPGSYVASESIEISRTQCDGSPAPLLLFKSSAPEGAILTMPNGAQSEDIIGTRRMKCYMTEHMASWYKFIVGVLGYDAENGDIHLVTGYDKTNSWGVATFVKSLDDVTLRFQPVESSHSYDWEYVGRCTAKTGPILASGEPLYNQCVFVRGIPCILQDDIWQSIQRSVCLEMGLDPDEELHGREGSMRDQGGLRATGHGGSTDKAKSMRGVEGGQRRVLLPNIESPISLVPNVPTATVTFGRKFPSARAVITEDNDWISVLQDSDSTLPDAEELYKRITEREMVENPSVDFLTRSFDAQATGPTLINSSHSVVSGGTEFYGQRHHLEAEEESTKESPGRRWSSTTLIHTDSAESGFTIFDDPVVLDEAYKSDEEQVQTHLSKHEPGRKGSHTKVEDYDEEGSGKSFMDNSSEEHSTDEEDGIRRRRQEERRGRAKKPARPSGPTASNASPSSSSSASTSHVQHQPLPPQPFVSPPTLPMEEPLLSHVPEFSHNPAGRHYDSPHAGYASPQPGQHYSPPPSDPDPHPPSYQSPRYKFSPPPGSIMYNSGNTISKVGDNNSRTAVNKKTSETDNRW